MCLKVAKFNEFCMEFKFIKKSLHYVCIRVYIIISSSLVNGMSIVDTFLLK